ncbi:MAG: subclass B3 metallo-beta-lactamase [Croceibacterium sp.]
MSAKLSASAAALLLAACAPVPSPATAQYGAVTPQQWAATCPDDAGWDDPGPPFRIHGNTWYVGTCGITAILITGNEGHVLIDSGTEKGAAVVAANVRRLGFRLEDVKLLLASHEHHDHVGGMAVLQGLTGAELAVAKEAALVLSTGRPAPEDPQFGINPEMTPAKVATVLPQDGRVMLGSIALQAVPTPGHTAGATSWQWQSCAGGDCRTIVYADSLSPISSDSYRFTDHPDYVQAFRDGLARLERLDCTMLITPHPSASDLNVRAAAGLAPDPAACARYARTKSAQLDARLAKEQAQ